ncbi:MAG: hypothetical protein MUO19_02445 [Dehalococcoidales bacterium]|nr:hypothetical protein [Dehalococcoidales bacterium]
MVDKVTDPRFIIGQKVVIQPVGEKDTTQRDNEISQYAGQIGQVADFFWISPRTGQIFYIYNVRVGRQHKEVVVYEDELEPCLS